MRRNNPFVSTIFLALSVFLLCMHGYIQKRGEAAIETQESNPSSEVEVCVQHFDIEKVDLNNPEIRLLLPYLEDYLLCRAAQDDDPKWFNLLGQYKLLSDKCNASFKQYHSYFGRVLINKQLTPAALSACMSKGPDFTEKVCRDMADSLLTGNKSKCNNLPPNMAGDCCKLVDSSTGNSMDYYLKALRTGKVFSCKFIPDGRVQSLCKGALEKSKGSCEDNKGFAYFRTEYCKTISK